MYNSKHFLPSAIYIYRFAFGIASQSPFMDIGHTYIIQYPWCASPFPFYTSSRLESSTIGNSCAADDDAMKDNRIFLNTKHGRSSISEHLSLEQALDHPYTQDHDLTYVMETGLHYVLLMVSSLPPTGWRMDRADKMSYGPGVRWRTKFQIWHDIWWIARTWMNCRGQTKQNLHAKFHPSLKRKAFPHYQQYDWLYVAPEKNVTQ